MDWQNLFWHEVDYHFFDYKYNIVDALGNQAYHGQDFDGFARWFYLVFSLVSILLLVILFRNVKKKRVEGFLIFLGIMMPFLDITKPAWESYWDIVTGHGFNFVGLLPLYTCSLFVFCSFLAAFCKGKVRDFCLSWMCTIGIVGGLSNVLFIQGLKWYPFFTFGAFYSMIYHYLMVFTALFIVVSGYKRFSWKDIGRAMTVHMIFSSIVIPLNYIFGWDYMQYNEAGGVPIIEDLSDKLAEAGMRWLTTPIMILLYLLFAALFTALYIGLQYLRFGKKEKEGVFV